MSVKYLESGKILQFKAFIESITLKHKKTTKNKNRCTWKATLKSVRVDGKLIKGIGFEMIVTNYYQLINIGDYITFTHRVNNSHKSEKKYEIKNTKNFEILNSPATSNMSYDLKERGLDLIVENIQTDYKNILDKELIPPLVSFFCKEIGMYDTFKYILLGVGGKVGKNKKSLYKTVLEKCKPTFYVVYHLIKDNEIIYIGSTKDLPTRIGKHRDEKVFDQVRLCFCSDKEDMLALENYNIYVNSPADNKTVNLEKVREYEFKDHHHFVNPYKDGVDFFPDYYDSNKYSYSDLYTFNVDLNMVVKSCYL